MSFKPLLLTLLLAPLAVAQTAAKAVPPATSDNDPIYLQEIKIRTAIHAHDVAAIGAMMAPGFLEVEDTISNRDQVLGFGKSCNVNSYKIHSHVTRMLSPDIAIIVYPVFMDVTCGKDHELGDFNDTTTWIRTPDTGHGPGKWLVQLHTNAVAAKP